MANLKDIKRKIGSVKNTQKTTRAMKLVSTAKLMKAKLAAERSREYAIKINDVLSEISYKINKYRVGGIKSRFFDINDNPKIVDIIFITADKGLCGGFNIQTIKAVNKLLDKYESEKTKIRLRAIGKKGIAYYNFKSIKMYDTKVGISSAPTYDKASEIINETINDFLDKKTDKVILIHNGYKNMISQELKVLDLVPIKSFDEPSSVSTSMIEVEPEDNTKLLDELAKKYFEYNMYYSLIDSLAAEHSARMQAMDSATNNASERVQELTLEYNKARQGSITTELIEIISGVEAQK